jgi:hypothetical protein
MANTISTSFIAQYNSEVHLAFQRGQLLRSTVRTAQAEGSTYIFQKIGTGVATDKARNGYVVPMNPTHGTATATLVDKFAPEYIDKLDTLKQNIDERTAMIKSAVMALQRAADAQIVTILDANASTSAGPSTTGLTMAKVAIALYQRLFAGDVPDDGQVTAAIGWTQYGELKQLQQFSGFEYVGDAKPMLRGSMQGTWNNVLWIPTSGLSTAGSTYRKCAVFHKSAIGHAIGQEISSEINYIPERVSWLIDAFMSMGAVEIDATGIVPMPCAE